MSILLRAYAALFARPVARRLNYFLFDCATRGLGLLNYHSLVASGEAHFVKNFLPKKLALKPVIFDVGANVGDYTALLQKQFSEAQIHAFEPNPESFVQLQRQASARTLCRPIGLSHTPGEFDLYQAGGTHGSPHASLFRDVIQYLHAQIPQAVRVKLETFDGYLAEQKVEWVDFLKIDTEGNELAVLQGAKQSLAQNRIGIIQFEFNDMNLVSRCFLRDFRLLLPKYKLFRMVRSGLLKIPQTPLRSELFAFQNIVALPAC